MTDIHKTLQSLPNADSYSKSVYGIVNSLIKENQILTNYNMISGVSNLAQNLSAQLKPYNMLANNFGNTLKEQISALQQPKIHKTMYNLASSLSEIAKSSQVLSSTIAHLAASQINLSTNLSGIAMAIKQSHLTKFNSLDVAVQGISGSFLRDISRSHHWEEVDVAAEATSVLTNITGDLLDTSEQITLKDLDNLRLGIIQELSVLLSKTKTIKARQFILDLMNVIAFLLSMYSLHQSNKDVSNNQAVIEIKNEIRQSYKDLNNKIEIEFKKLNDTRVARTNINLRFSNKKNSKIIGLVKVNQIVTVIEIIKENLLITFIDQERGEPKSGFVKKKYFYIVK